MPRPFNQEFLSLYRKKPFSDEDRVNLRVFVEAMRRELGVDDLGSALHLDGVNDYARIPHNVAWGANTGLNIINEISIEFWAYWENVGVDVDVICSKGIDVYQVETGAAANNSLVFTPVAGTTVTSPLDSFPSDQWNHVVVTWDDVGPAGVIYVNGVNTGAAVVGAGPLAASVAEWDWGQEVGGTNPFEGWLDECRVYGRVLSQAEVTELYNAGVGYFMDAEMFASDVGYDYELRGCWHWDEGVGIVSADSSGNSGDADLMLGAAWIEGHLEVPDCFTTVADRVYDAMFIPTARNLELDEWGATLDNPRNVAETDPAYRLRLLAQMQLANNCLTVQAVTDAVNAIGATYLPVITVERIHEYYKPYYAAPSWGRRADGVTPGDDCLGEIHGLSDHDFLTFGVELNRSPSVAEAWELVAGTPGGLPGIYEIKPAQTRGHIITDMGLPAPPRYRMHSWAYSLGLAPWSWDDNFYRGPGVALPATPWDRYWNRFPVAGGGGGWTYVGPPYELLGDASLNNAVADAIVPLPWHLASGVEFIVIEDKNIYMYARAYFTTAGVNPLHFAGFIFRCQPAALEWYAVVFNDPSGAGAWEYAIMYFDSLAWNIRKAWAVTGFDMTAMREIEIWIRDDTNFSMRIDGNVIIDEHAVAADIIDAGEQGFVTAQTEVDINVDEYRYW